MMIIPYYLPRIWGEYFVTFLTLMMKTKDQTYSLSMEMICAQISLGPDPYLLRHLDVFSFKKYIENLLFMSFDIDQYNWQNKKM